MSDKTASTAKATPVVRVSKDDYDYDSPRLVAWVTRLMEKRKGRPLSLAERKQIEKMGQRLQRDSVKGRAS